VRHLANNVTLPAGRRREAAGASFLGGVLGRAASFAGRVFRDRASFLFVRFASSNAPGQGCAPTSDVVAHADRAGNGAAFQTGSFQGRLFGSTANHVALPAGRRREAAGASFLGGVLGRAASAAGRVFRDSASGGLLAFSLAAGQGGFEALDVVAHADRAGIRATGQAGSGQFRRWFRDLGGAANHVALPGLRRHEAALARFLGGDRGRAASLGARGVFRNLASRGLLAC